VMSLKHHIRKERYYVNCLIIDIIACKDQRENVQSSIMTAISIFVNVSICLISKVIVDFVKNT